MGSNDYRLSVDGMDSQGSFFRLISPEDYPHFGIDPQDVPMGTFASEDHPSYLPSRFGGNAYGLGLIEQSVLTDADTDFLESIDFEDPREIARHARSLNAIYQKLGLLIRFSASGKRYFLIPINLVAHSLREINGKADEIEEQLIRHIWETRSEQLEIGLFTTDRDLIVHELAARLSSHRIVLFDSLDKLSSWRIPLDIAIIPNDVFEYLLGQKLPRVSKRSLSRQRLLQYAMYLAGKIFDLLDRNGRFLVLAHAPAPREDHVCRVRFRSEEELKSFLVFSHIFSTRRDYTRSAAQTEMDIHLADLHYYLGRFAYSEPHIRQLFNDQRPEDLGIEEINDLPRLNLKLPDSYMKNPEKSWKVAFEPYFATVQLRRKSPKHQSQYWEERLEVGCELPENLLVYVGRPKQPEISLADLEDEVKRSGTQGCSLPLVAHYRNSFRYVLDVLDIVTQIRDQEFHKLSELERSRLSNPFRSHTESFTAIHRLLSQRSRLEKIREVLNPDRIEGPATPILENIPKLSLHGLTPAQLREILLIVVGHSTMGRIVFGKLPAKTLKPVTDRGADGHYTEILELLRVCRLMSIAEIAAALGDDFTGEQARELYRIYDDAIDVATNPNIDWEKLHDLKVSALGGVRNKAIREILKLFNLFELLDDWQEFLDKGAFEKEVICDHQPDKLQRLEEALELARTAERFKEQFLGDVLFGESYLFRQFLETEFHGTGHLLPRLGARAGFVLLWIAVHSSEKRIVNFNPMLAGVPEGRIEERAAQIRETLLRIEIERLHTAFFQEVRQTLATGHSAFVFDSGLRMVLNADTRALDFSYVDVDENIEQIEALLTHFESQRLRGISLKSFQDMERLFSELASYRDYLAQEQCYLRCDPFERSEILEAKGKTIGAMEKWLKGIFRSQIFIPEEIYETISVLARHCPQVLRVVLPEFHVFGSLVEHWPTRRKQPLGHYIMRCLEKFQALITRDRGAFQDPNTFYQLAKHEFGPLAEAGIGASHAQLDILEYLVDRIQQRPHYYQALTLALLFQDIGKIESYGEVHPEVDLCWTHADRGAQVLRRAGILKSYDLDPHVEELVTLLVRYHGLSGHILLGEEPFTALECYTRRRDDRLIDVFILHGILAAAAVEEGLMVTDLLDQFLAHRALALQMLSYSSDWSQKLRDILRDKGEAVLTDFRLDGDGAQMLPDRGKHYCGFTDEDFEDESLWHGRQCAALERLLKLMSLPWVDYQDLQMHLLKMPVNFIYHKKKLKSVGLETFERQLRAAEQLLEILSRLEVEIRYYLLYCLDHLGAGMRVYHFAPLSRFLEPENCLKLLLMAFQTFHREYGPRTRGGLISFRKLGQVVDRRHQVVSSILTDMPFPSRCFDPVPLSSVSENLGELCFELSPREPAIQVVYKDAREYHQMAENLGDCWSYEELSLRFQELIEELKVKLPYDTRHLEEELQQVVEHQLLRINEHVLKSIQASLDEVDHFSELQEIQEGVSAQLASVNLSDDQRMLLKEMFEYHRSRLRETYLDAIHREISSLESEDELVAFWNRIKLELFSYREYVGKEFETLVARFIDRKLPR
ncbi:MAG: hypothetical protein MUF52_12720 [Syntrophobacteraceae bacterium]|nr:hypothetical protein [Syntrophobacteraceae bacterium]